MILFLSYAIIGIGGKTSKAYVWLEKLKWQNWENDWPTVQPYNVQYYQLYC